MYAYPWPVSQHKANGRCFRVVNLNSLPFIVQQGNFFLLQHLQNHAQRPRMLADIPHIPLVQQLHTLHQSEIAHVEPLHELNVHPVARLGRLARNAELSDGGRELEVEGQVEPRWELEIEYLQPRTEVAESGEVGIDVGNIVINGGELQVHQMQAVQLEELGKVPLREDDAAELVRRIKLYRELRVPPKERGDEIQVSKARQRQMGSWILAVQVGGMHMPFWSGILGCIPRIGWPCLPREKPLTAQGTQIWGVE